MARHRTTERSEEEKRLAALAAVAGKSKAFRPAREVLKLVRSVPTIFPSVDMAMRIGGWPIERTVLLHGAAGMGKAQSLDSQILTPAGWRRFGDLKVGDRVIGSDGEAHGVTGIYPQGKRQLYRVTFNDGVEVVCCAEHLWFTRTESERQRGRFVRGPRPERRKVPTGVEGSGSVKVLDDIRRDPSLTHEVPYVAPVIYESIGELPLHPYLLGLFLGDGNCTQTATSFTNSESDLHEKFRSLLPLTDEVVERDELTLAVRRRDRSHVQTTLKSELRSLGIDGCHSYEKFVPQMYLRASPQERLDLLRGLIDTDGTVHENGTMIEYSSTSPHLASAVVDLVRGLGGFARCMWRTTSFTYKGVKKKGRKSARVFIRFTAESGIVPASSEKHLSRWRPARARRSIKKVVADKYDECMCIAVDAPDHLYVTDGYTLTHNTYLSNGIGLSFLKRGHFFKMIDAERSTPLKWIEELFHGYVDHPGFSALHPSTYEAAVADVRDWCNAIGNAKAKGVLPKDVTGIAVVDSVRKLVPKNFFDRMTKVAAEENAEKKGNRVNQKTVRKDIDLRGAQMKAHYHALWGDELTGLLDDTGTAMILITREHDDPDADFRDKLAGRDYKISGGKALVYDSSLRARVERTYVYGPGKEGERRPIYGECHKVTIGRSKIAGMKEREEVGYFCTSNGVLVPAGFDTARDVVRLGKKLGILKGETWLSWRKNRWNGEHRAVVALTKDAIMLGEIEREIRAHFADAI